MKTRFIARTIKGSGRGKEMGTPTINLGLSDVPAELQEGIYAARVIIGNETYNAAMHYGPRPVHKDVPSCEVHILDAMIEEVPETIEIEPVAFIRPVLDFPTEEALMVQIADDITRIRGILSAHESEHSETAGS